MLRIIFILSLFFIFKNNNYSNHNKSLYKRKKIKRTIKHLSYLKKNQKKFQLKGPLAEIDQLVSIQLQNVPLNLALKTILKPSKIDNTIIQISYHIPKINLNVQKVPLKDVLKHLSRYIKVISYNEGLDSYIFKI